MEKNDHIPIEQYNQKVENDLLAHITAKKKKGNIFLVILIVIVLIGMFAYYKQVRYGLIVTAMRDYTSCGLYI